MQITQRWVSSGIAMKSKIILTAVVVALSLGAMSLWNTIKSPIAGAASAAQLDDTAQSYIVARAVQENFVENSIKLSCVGLLAIVWLVPAKKNNKQKTP